MGLSERKNSGRVARWILLPAMAVPMLGLGYFATRGSWLGESEVQTLQGSEVRRGPLLISILTRGDLSAADSSDLRCELEGRTTILWLLPDGTQVSEGDLVCELDATPLVQQKFQQEIGLRNAEAAFVKATQNHEIQLSQNRSDIAKAVQKLEFAKLDLNRYLEGERASELEKAKQTIDLAKEDATRAASKLSWSAKLAEKGFLTSSELEADRIAEHRASVVLQQATRDLDLLERFQLIRKEAELRAALAEATFERERVELQAKARIVDFQADLSTNEAKLGLEREKLIKLDAQIAKARMHAPRSGLIVYAQLDSDEPPIQEGTQVRERQVILSIPSATGMKAQSKIHESVLDQVALGMPCTITVDALPGRTFAGTISYLAVLPDQSMRWSNPNLRMYRTDIAIDASASDMRPGMSCAVRVNVEEIPDALYVPVQCVFREQRGNVAYVATPAGVDVRPVTVGRYNVEHVQILSGLAEGETVLLSRPADRGETDESTVDDKSVAPKAGAVAPTSKAKAG